MQSQYRVNISDEALTALEAIFDYISRDSPQNAARVIERLLDEIDDLDFMPRRFKVVGRSRSEGTPVHSRVARPFIIYYRVDQQHNMVFILTIRHGARRQPKHFP